MDDISLLLKLRRIAVILTFLIILIVSAVTLIRFNSDYTSSIDNATSGYITKKEVIPARASSFIFFRYHDTEYRIYINFNYKDIFGIDRQGSKYFSVSETEYQQYHVGDFFDVSFI